VAIAVLGTYRALAALAVWTATFAVWPIRALAGILVSAKVAEYETTPLVVAGVGETAASEAVSVVPGSALRVTVADWPALILIASASAKAATTWRDFRSARSTKPELEVVVVLEVVPEAEP
jgi:hypothetical protein